MSLGQRIIELIEARRVRKQRDAAGPLGDFFRAGGNDLLCVLPVKTGDLVIDAGGYEGQWTSQMLARYGCRSEIFEPLPRYADHCSQLFRSNGLVNVHHAALGGSDRTTRFSLAADGSSEFQIGTKDSYVVADVVDVARFVDELEGTPVACLKLNIEGGEYEVLERLLESRRIALCTSLLIQFHNRPDDWERRLPIIRAGLEKTHLCEWSHQLVWEKWVRRS